MKKLIFVFSMALFGCVESVTETRGTTITISPVEHQFSVSSDDVPFAMNRFEQFWHQYPVQSQSRWVIISYSPQGANLAKRYQRALSQRGISAQQMDIRHRNEPQRFDVKVALFQLHTQVEICHQEKIDHFGAGTLGCYTDGVRWQSMVNPQNAF